VTTSSETSQPVEAPDAEAAKRAKAPRLLSPLTLYRIVARTEAVTWALLIIGMFLKYGTKTTDMGVRIAGMLHGIAFVSFVVVTAAVWIDNTWSVKRGLLGLASAIPPFFTLIFDANAEKHEKIASTWRLGPAGRPDTAQSLPEKLLARVLVNPKVAILVAVALVAVLTILALIVGPPAST
jgi:integral membrane protein